ncbi:MAG: MogA/MoaB family molybdenum cofactor biosynthesis protein [Desulfobaccales bacterium]
MFRVGILTVSDKGHAGEREDTAGPELARQLDSRCFMVAAYQVVPDEPDVIAAQLVAWSDNDNLDLILTTGGTGLSPRDTTPEATLSVAHRLVPGIPEAMRVAGLAITPHAMLSRGVAVIRGHTLIINLPGSPKGARENLAAVAQALPHALEKLQGSPSDCGAP